MKRFNHALKQHPTLLNQARQLATQLPANSTLAAYSQNAEHIRLALATASLRKCRLILPSSNATQMIQAIDNTCDYWLTDEPLNTTKPQLLLTEHTPSSTELSEAHDIPIILTTSGSTGNPKRLELTLSALCGECAGFAYLLNTPSLMKATVSLQHRYGLAVHVLFPFLYGWESQAQSCELPDLLLSGEKQAVFWVSSPAFLQRLAEHPELATWKNHVKGIFSAGGKLSDHLRQQLEQQLNTSITDIYGSSETGIIASKRNRPFFQWLNSLEIKQQGVETTVILPWQDTPITLGDRLKAETAREFTILGRLDSIIKIADKRIDLDDLNHLLQSDTRIADSHLSLHPETGRLFAWLALNDTGIEQLREHGRQTLRQALSQHIATHYPRIAIPRHWLFTSQLPRNSQSKIAHADLLAAREQPPISPSWHCLENSTEHAHYCGRVPLDLLYCRGHFEQYPIVPGVIEIKWALELIAQWQATTAINSAQLENVKFQQLLRPSDLINVKLSKTAQSKICFTLANEQGTTATGRLPL